MGRHVNWTGLVVAGIGFFLTRFTVTFALYQDPVRFYVAGVLPLAVGLGLAAFGVALTVANLDRTTVRLTALWCVIGAGSMGVLVVLTLIGSTAGGVPDLATVRSQVYLSNFLIGGSVGGTLTGLYAARNRQQRQELEEQTNRLIVVNRLLRHEVLNAVTAIQGYASLSDEAADEGTDVIRRRSSDIEGTIEEVKYLTHRAQGVETGGVPTPLSECLEESVASVTDRHEDVSVEVDGVPEDLTVEANERLSDVFVHLLENAVVHGETQAPAVRVSTSGERVLIAIEDEGPGLPPEKQELLETGRIGDFDDPKAGFGLNIVRLLVESFGGRIETAVDEGGTTVTVELRQASSAETGPDPSQSEFTRVAPAIPHLVVTLFAALLAGAAYGAASELMGSSVAGIGVFYGTERPDLVVGWLTHEFHSVVFGFVFLGLVSTLPRGGYNRLLRYVAVGLAWGVVLWAIAASIIGPTWLQLLGIPAAIPSFQTPLLVSHLVWGATLGVLTAVGFRYLSPRLERAGDAVLSLVSRR